MAVINGGTGNDNLIGTSSADIFYGNEGNDTLNGGGGDDTIYGGVGHDSIVGGMGADLMIGGPGNDFYLVDNANDQVSAEYSADGYDSVISSVNYTLPIFNFEFLGLTGAGVAIGNGNMHSNTIIRGHIDAATLNGYDGDDYLGGNRSNDILIGGNGNDSLYGGYGMDTLQGDAGADKFTYGIDINESPANTNRDKIIGFNRVEGDKIDLSAIDANLTLIGNQAFTQGSYVNGILTGDVIGGADIQIELVGAPALDLISDIIH